MSAQVGDTAPDQVARRRPPDRRGQQLLVQGRGPGGEAHLGAGQPARVRERGQHHAGPERVHANRRAPGEDPARAAAIVVHATNQKQGKKLPEEFVATGVSFVPVTR